MAHGRVLLKVDDVALEAGGACVSTFHVTAPRAMLLGTWMANAMCVMWLEA